VYLLPSGKSTLMSPCPNALMVDPSAVHTSWALIVSKVMNLARSGQKCEVAPESMIVPPCPAWTEAVVANVKLSGDRAGAAVAVLAAGLPPFLRP
jgi:hypothetical protein